MTISQIIFTVATSFIIITLGVLARLGYEVIIVSRHTKSAPTPTPYYTTPEQYELERDLKAIEYRDRMIHGDTPTPTTV